MILQLFAEEKTLFMYELKLTYEKMVFFLEFYKTNY